MFITFENDEGDEDAIELPAKYEVCPTCRGKGSHVNRNIDGNGITASEWEEDWDEEGREAYMRGDYDVPCEECGGERVVLVVDAEACTHGSPELKAALERYRSAQDSIAESRAIEAAERRMGA